MRDPGLAMSGQGIMRGSTDVLSLDMIMPPREVWSTGGLPAGDTCFVFLFGANRYIDISGVGCDAALAAFGRVGNVYGA